jgi:macrolide-specific efflux system membrane fusion protein
MDLKKDKSSWKKLIFLAIAIIAIWMAVWYLFFRKTNEMTYLTEPVKRGNIEQSIVAAGTVRSNNRVEVGAQASGKITKINVVVGQEVKKGDLLATIDSMTQENDLNTAKSKLYSYEAQLKGLEVDLKVSQSYYKRIKNLYEKNSASLDDYETAEKNLADTLSSVKQMEELINQAKISVSIAETNLSYTTIVSPIDGVVISIPVSVGQTINSTQVAPTLIQVADLKKMLIKPEIPEGDVTQVAAGMKVEFTTLANPDKVYDATIQSVDPSPTTLIDDEYDESVSDTSAIYYYANIIVDNDENLLRIGMSTTNTIKVATADNVLLIPTTALTKRNGKYFVKVLRDGKEVVEKNVEIGLSDDFNTEIKSGLSEGERVVLSQMASGETLDENRRRGPF